MGSLIPAHAVRHAFIRAGSNAIEASDTGREINLPVLGVNAARAADPLAKTAIDAFFMIDSDMEEGNTREKAQNPSDGTHRIAEEASVFEAQQVQAPEKDCRRNNDGNSESVERNYVEQIHLIPRQYRRNGVIEQDDEGTGKIGRNSSKVAERFKQIQQHHAPSDCASDDDGGECVVNEVRGLAKRVAAVRILFLCGPNENILKRTQRTKV